MAGADEYQRLIALGSVWVADDAARPVALLAAEAFGHTFHILELAVARSHQRRGLGRRLMAAALDAARDGGLVAATLTTFRTVAWNAPFYASLGFRALEPHELDPRLAAALRREADRGFEGRCAMRLSL